MNVIYKNFNLVFYIMFGLSFTAVVSILILMGFLPYVVFYLISYSLSFGLINFGKKYFNTSISYSLWLIFYSITCIFPPVWQHYEYKNLQSDGYYGVGLLVIPIVHVTSLFIFFALSALSEIIGRKFGASRLRE